MLAIVTGCRRGELGALTWADIDFKGRVLRISESLEQAKVGLRVKPTKTEKPRDIPLPKSAIELLREHRGRQPENRRLFGAAYRDDLNQESGTQWVKPSHLRHSHGSQLLANGVPLPVVSKRVSAIRAFMLRNNLQPPHCQRTSLPRPTFGTPPFRSR
jgi:integrase